MAINGVHHIGLASNDYEGTLEFYTKIVGWEVAWQDQNFSQDGTEVMRHLFLDAGNGTYLAFMCSVPGSPMFPETWGTDINSGLGFGGPVYHFSFSVESEDDLTQLKDRWTSRGLEVSGIFDHGWCKSIYFRDPINGLLLEASIQTRVFGDDDKLLKTRVQGGFKGSGQEELERSARILDVPVSSISKTDKDNFAAAAADAD